MLPIWSEFPCRGKQILLYSLSTFPVLLNGFSCTGNSEGQYGQRGGVRTFGKVPAEFTYRILLLRP